MRCWVRAVTVAGLSVLAGCGGGGGGGAEPQPVVTVPPLSSRCEAGSLARLDTEPLVVGRSSELHLLSCGGALANIQWSQSGPNTQALLSARAPALTLTPTLPGTQRFTVQFGDAQGRSHSGSVDLVVAPNDLPRGLLTRGEPSVWGGGQTSVRAWPQGYSAAELSGSRVRWERVSGPALTLADSASSLLVLSAPSVSTDELLVLRATLTLANGSQVQDEFRLLVQPPPSPAASPLFNGSSAATRVYPYQANGPHAAALARCIYTPALQWNPNNLCTLGELPLLGQGGVTPTIEQVMQRVLVSHDWMGEVFERFLREHDPHGDFRRMLASTTAVVIGGRVRPAFYWNTTGAIYLDGAYLWLTPEQRDTLSEAPDPRSANGPLLQYTMPWRYVKDNQYATPARPVAERSSRSLDEARIELARLLYHELTHAADLVPPRLHAVLNPSRKVFESKPSASPSDLLRQQQPFRSQEMVDLGRVLFDREGRVQASDQQNRFLPSDVTTFFVGDKVTDDYSYAWPRESELAGEPPREDTAMLVEEALMQLRYGVMRDVAVTNRLVDGASSADLRVHWGQRGRIGEALIRPRLQLVLAEVMPWLPASTVDGLAAPRLLKAGLTWGQNLDQGAVALSRPRALSAAERLREDELATERNRTRGGRPGSPAH